MFACRNTGPGISDISHESGFIDNVVCVCFLGGFVCKLILHCNCVYLKLTHNSQMGLKRVRNVERKYRSLGADIPSLSFSKCSESPYLQFCSPEQSFTVFDFSGDFLCCSKCYLTRFFLLAEWNDPKL